MWYLDDEYNYYLTYDLNCPSKAEIRVNSTSQFVDACNKIIADANMTAEDANAYFDTLGFETSFVTEPQTQTQRVPEYVTETVPDGTTTTTDTISTQKTNYTASANYVNVTKLTGTNCKPNITTGWKSINDKIT